MRKKTTAKDADYLKVSLLFMATAALLYTVVTLLFSAGYLYFLINLTARYSTFFINLVGISASSSLTSIYLKSRTLLVTFECTAIYIAVLYSSLVIIYPAPLKRKLAGLAGGIPFIFIVNVARLVFVAFVSENLPANYFNYIHDYLWQVSFILLTTVLWLIFARGQNDEAKTAVRA